MNELLTKVLKEVIAKNSKTLYVFTVPSENRERIERLLRNLDVENEKHDYPICTSINGSQEKSGRKITKSPTNFHTKQKI